MKRDKQARAYAKSLLRICFVDGEFSEERAAAVLRALEANPPRQYLSVLKAFLGYVRAAVADRTADVEHAGDLSPEAVESIRADLSSKYGRTIDVHTRQNDALIAGLRVRVGWDVYDASVAGSLAELQTSLS